MTFVRACLAAAAGSLLVATTAQAAPTIWERARHPESVTEAQLLAALERTLDARRLVSADPDLTRNLARAAVAMAELSRIRVPRDPRLAYFMAKAMLIAGDERAEEASGLLKHALASLPVGPLATDAWQSLGVARALLGDDAGAHAAQSRVVEDAWDPDDRALGYYNRAEASVRLGRLDAAIADYEQAIRETSEPEHHALALYGLAVALERRGDLPSAYVALSRAIVITLPVPPYPTEDPLALPGVFFVPAYERHYVQGLAAMAFARQAERTAARRGAYQLCVAEWDAYLRQAASSEPWLSNAVSHRARCERELRALPREQPARPL